MKQKFQRDETEVSQFAPTLPESQLPVESFSQAERFRVKRVWYPQRISTRSLMYPEVLEGPKAQVPRPKNPLFSCVFLC